MAGLKQPRYRVIALRIAEQISANQLKVGEKIHARSTLATTYGVSSETARRAISVLGDLGIVETMHGSGAKVVSRQKAQKFVESETEVNGLQDLQISLTEQIKAQQAGLDALSKDLQHFVDQSQHYQQHNPLTPFELELTEPSILFDKSLSELNFWHQTGTTLVGIAYEEKLVISPGPYAKIHQGDTLYFVGDENSVQNVYNFFYSN